MKQNNTPKPTKTEQEKALQKITIIMAEVNSKLQECQEISEKYGVQFSLQTTDNIYITYYPKSPWLNNWLNSTTECEDSDSWPKCYEGWMSSSDECNAV
jgi:hypothetical protein